MLTNTNFKRVFSFLFFFLSASVFWTGCHNQDSGSAPHFQNLPAWANEAVVYELFVRDFTPQGTFKATQEKIPYLKELGVDIVWLMPIYPIGQKGRKGSLGSPYSVQNYYEVNPEFGTKQDFKNLVRAIHQAGLKIIIGFVPNHSANDYVEMAQHPDWFMRDQNGKFTREVQDWSDITDFNYDNPDLRKHIIEILKYWIREFDIDGYRFDVAGMVPDDFWRQAVPAMRSVKEELFLLAEWEDHKFIDFGFSADYNWKMLHAFQDLQTHSKTVGQMLQIYQTKYEQYFPEGRFLSFIENHDEQRAVKKFGIDRLEPYAAFIFTTPGLPLLFMGQEFGDTNYNASASLFEKVTINWQDFDSTLFSFYKKLTELRHAFPFNAGQWQVVHHDNQTRTLVYSNILNNQAVVAVLNFDDKAQTVAFEIPDTLHFIMDRPVVEWLTGKEISLQKSNRLTMQPFSAKILVAID
ncbi:alpha-amylase family glycosyl hydrolase [Caldithrix abyssi]